MIIMMEKSRYDNDVMFSAMSGLLFFGLFVQYWLKKVGNTWDESEKNFVNSWCVIGNYVLILLLLFFFNVVIFEATSFSLFSIFAKFFGFLMLFLIVISLPLVVSWKNIRFYKVDTTVEEKKQILSAFVPFLSSYQWFSLKSYDTPNFWLKEAQLWFLVVWLLLFFFNSWMVALVFAGFLLLRIFFLMIWWDIFSNDQKQRMRHWFLVYPEEAFSVVFVFLKQWISLLLKKEEVSVEELLKYQESYRSTWSLKTYLWTLLFICWWFVLVYYWWIMWLYRKILPIIWIFLRIWVLFYTKTRIPKIPIVAELTS